MADRVAVIGGTGLYLMDGVKDVRDVEVTTPFGPPSDRLTIGRYAGREVVFLPRHGRGHRFLPTEVPYRANLYALKTLGVTRVFSVSAVGSMKEEIAIGTPVLVDQFVDRTRGRASTFFGNGIVAHVSIADPVCSSLHALLGRAAERIGLSVHPGGTYLCIEGPQFSTRAESFLYRDFGVDVIGMTNATEARLAREAEMCFATIALPTDYDCWHDGHVDVNVGSVVETLRSNTRKACSLILAAIEDLDSAVPGACGQALAGAILTDRAAIPADARERLGPIVSKYLD